MSSLNDHPFLRMKMIVSRMLGMTDVDVESSHPTGLSGQPFVSSFSGSQ